MSQRMEVFGTDDRQTPDEANRVAVAILDKHQVKAYPVPICAIAEREGAVIRYISMTGDGALTRRPTGYVIQVNKDAPVQRQRYTIAHEVGPYHVG